MFDANQKRYGELAEGVLDKWKEYNKNPTDEEKEWDGSPDFTLTLKTEEAVKEEPVQEKTSKTTASSKTSKPKLPMDKFSEETPTKTEKTAS